MFKTVPYTVHLFHLRWAARRPASLVHKEAAKRRHRAVPVQTGEFRIGQVRRIQVAFTYMFLES